jgi:hypothetical protein
MSWWLVQRWREAKRQIHRWSANFGSFRWPMHAFAQAIAELSSATLLQAG